MIGPSIPVVVVPSEPTMPVVARSTIVIGTVVSAWSDASDYPAERPATAIIAGGLSIVARPLVDAA